MNKKSQESYLHMLESDWLFLSKGADGTGKSIKI